MDFKLIYAHTEKNISMFLRKEDLFYRNVEIYIRYYQPKSPIILLRWLLKSKQNDTFSIEVFCKLPIGPFDRYVTPTYYSKSFESEGTICLVLSGTRFYFALWSLLSGFVYLES